MLGKPVPETAPRPALPAASAARPTASSVLSRPPRYRRHWTLL